MAERSEISWTDATFNPWEGCQKVGPGCDNCYAEARNARFAGGTAINWGPGSPRRRTSVSNWNLPKKWNEQLFCECPDCGTRGNALAMAQYNPLIGCRHPSPAPARRRVFCSSLADVFDNAVDPQWRIDLWDLIDATPNLDWMLLTKRVGNVRDMVPLRWLQPGAWPAHVRIGATIVNQPEADRDIEKLLALPCPNFLSMEPLLGPVDLGQALSQALAHIRAGRTLDWVIVGGESGPGARQFDIAWARSLVAQCKAAGVAVHVKQLGANPAPLLVEAGSVRERLFLKHKKGGDPAEWPVDLRVKEFPNA